MAIQLLDPNLQGEFTHISVADPALDRDAEDFESKWEQYMETGSMPPLKDGEEPTVFKLKPIEDAELDAKIRGKIDGTGIAWAVETACYSLKAIDNLRDHNGKKFELKFESVDGFRKVCREHRNLLGRELLAELGLVCIGKQSPS